MLLVLGMLGNREKYPDRRSAQCVVVVMEQCVISASHPWVWAAARKGLITAVFPGKNNHGINFHERKGREQPGSDSLHHISKHLPRPA